MSKRQQAEEDTAPTYGEAEVPETKADKFRRLCNLRLAQLEKVAKNIAALANRKAYDYTDDQRTTVVSVSVAAYERIYNSFTNGAVVKAETASYV